MQKRKATLLFAILLVSLLAFLPIQFIPVAQSQGTPSTVATITLPANCTLISTTENGYNWQTASTFYKLMFKAHSNWGDGLRFSVTFDGAEYAFIYQPQDYSFRDKYGSQDYLSPIADVVGAVQNNTITYTNVYQGVSLRYTALPDMVKEEYIIYQMPTKTPATYLTPPVTLDFGGYVKFPANVKVYVSGTEMTGSFRTSSKIEFGTAPDNILFYIPEPYAIDANGQKTTCEYEVKSQGNQIWFYIRIPYTWLSTPERTFPVTVDPSVVGTSTSSYATRYPFQRKSFYANGRFWVFYSDGTNMVYRTSTDGSTWTSATAVRTASFGNGFSIWFDGTYLHYAYAFGTQIYYRRGAPNSDGSITWSAAEQTVSTTYNNAYYPMVSVDSNGYVWIGYMEYTGTYYYPYVIKSGNNDGTWGTTPSPFPYPLSTSSSLYWRVSVIPLTSGKMLAVYAKLSTTISARKWDGSAWGTEVATTSAIYYGYDYSAVAQGDDVHLAFLKGTGYDILYTKYSYASNSFSAETTLVSGATYTSDPVISIDTSTNDLYVFAATETTNQPSGWTANHIYYIKYTASTGQWGSWTDWIDETSEVLTGSDKLTCFYKAYGARIGLVYMTNTTSPYNVKFAFLPPQKLNLRIKDTNGNTINGATALVSQISGLSDSDGWVNFTLIQNSTVSVIVKYQDVWVNGTFTVTMDSDKTIDVICNVYQLTIQVQTITGDPVPNYPIQLYRDNTLLNGLYSLPLYPKTNSTGHYVYPQLANTTYTIKSPYLTPSNTTTLTENKIATLTLNFNQDPLWLTAYNTTISFSETLTAEHVIIHDTNITLTNANLGSEPEKANITLTVKNANLTISQLSHNKKFIAELNGPTGTLAELTITHSLYQSMPGTVAVAGLPLTMPCSTKADFDSYGGNTWYYDTTTNTVHVKATLHSPTTIYIDWNPPPAPIVPTPTPTPTPQPTITPTPTIPTWLIILIIAVATIMSYAVVKRARK
jgi:hypothetical protein